MTGIGPVDGPCEPYTSWEEISACGTAPDVETVIQDLVVDLATDLMWWLSGKRFTGECVKTIAPCWRGSCGCEPCQCSWTPRLDLGVFPVWGVDSVEIDGDVVDNTDGVAYFVEDWRYLVYRGGPSWPRCRGDWFITLQYGRPIPVSLRRASSVLGLEYAKQCAGVECGLNPATQSYTREGVSVTLTDPATIIETGDTGIRAVNLILSALGGKGPQAGMVDLSSRNRDRVVTWDLADVDA